MNYKLICTAFGVAMLAATSLTHANSTYSSFIDVDGSVSFDGWNQLNRNRLNDNGDLTPLTAQELLDGTAGNVTGSGDAIFTQLRGTHYPAGAGLYGGNGLFTFTDNTVDSSANYLVFQGIINDFSVFDGVESILKVTLDYNGGTQGIAAQLIAFGDTGTAEDYYRYAWDFTTFDAPVTSYTITLEIDFSQLIAFQVDQTTLSPVPEPSTYAALLAGAAMAGIVIRRRKRA